MDPVPIAGVAMLIGGVITGFWLMLSPREETYEALSERLALLRITGIVMMPAVGLVNMGLGAVVALIYLTVLIGLLLNSRRIGAIDGSEIHVFGVWAAAGLLVWLVGVFSPGIDFLYMLAAGVVGGVIVLVDRCLGGRCRPRIQLPEPTKEAEGFQQGE